MPETSVLRETIVRNGRPSRPTARSRAMRPAPARARRDAVRRPPRRDAALARWLEPRGAGPREASRSSAAIRESASRAGHGVRARGERARRPRPDRRDRIARNAPYQAIVEALRSALPLVASLRLEPIWLAVLATLMPELDGPARRPTAVAADRDRARARAIVRSADRTLQALAEPRPCCSCSRTSTGRKPRQSTRSRFSRAAWRSRPCSSSSRIATTRRHCAIHCGAAARTLRAGNAQSISLRALSLADVEQLSRELGEPRRCSAEVLHRASAGNPLLLGQLLEEPSADDGADRHRRSMR